MAPVPSEQSSAVNIHDGATRVPVQTPPTRSTARGSGSAPGAQGVTTVPLTIALCCSATGAEVSVPLQARAVDSNPTERNRDTSQVWVLIGSSPFLQVTGWRCRPL